MERYVSLPSVMIIVILCIKKHKDLKLFLVFLVTELQEESTFCLVSIRVTFPGEVLKSCTSQLGYSTAPSHTSIQNLRKQNEKGFKDGIMDNSFTDLFPKM